MFVGGLHPKTVEDEVLSYFSQFGEVKKVRFMKDKLTRNFLRAEADF
jgi:RNA recognition motif-containing protein